MYAIKITKSDLALVTLLNGGVRPELPLKGAAYLIVRLEGHNEIVSESAFKKDYATYANGPKLLKLKK